MNKHIILLLAVCLVSVHAFVKREAETATTPVLPTLEDIKKKLEDVFNPEEIKKNFNNAIDKISNTINELQAKSATPKQ